jgi:predicted ArsR family transcriptional regulator
MNMQSRQGTKNTTQMLVELRKQHAVQVKKAQDLLRGQQSVRKKLQRAMQGRPHSIPQLAATTGTSPHEVLWHMTAMKKYGLVEEAGMDEAGEYYMYSLSKEVKA